MRDAARAKTSRGSMRLPTADRCGILTPPFHPGFICFSFRSARYSHFHLLLPMPKPAPRPPLTEDELALLKAAYAGDLTKVQSLVAQGINVNVQSHEFYDMGV